MILLTCGMKKTLLLLIAILCAASCLGAVDSGFERLGELSRQGRFGLLLEEAARMKREKGKKMTLPEELRLGRYYTTGLLGCRRYKECLDELNAMIELPKPDSLRYYDLNAYLGMNDIFCATGNAVYARTALRKAEETLEVIETGCGRETFEKSYGRLHMAMAVLAQSEEDMTEAMRQWRLSERARSVSPAFRIAWLGLGGTLWQDSGYDDKAREYFIKALDVPHFNPNKTAILLRLMAIDINRGDHQAALDRMSEYEDAAAYADNPEIRAMLLHAEGDALHGLGRWREASERLREAIMLEDSVARADSRLIDSMMSEMISLEDYSALKKRVESAESRVHRIVIISLVCVIVLLVAISIILVMKIRASRSSRSMEMRMRLSEQEKETVAGELSESKKELCNVSLAAAQTESMLITIRSEVRRDSSSAEERLRSIESVLRESAGIAQLQENFRTQFDETNQALYTRLSLRHPDLTKTEMNMAAYVLLNLNSKDIARMTSRSVRTVDNIKYNLRRKLAVTEPTAVYLRRLMSESADGPDGPDGPGRGGRD